MDKNRVLATFQHQAGKNEIYKSYLKAIGTNPAEISRVEQIPFLPITFFKSQVVKCGDWISQHIFESSGTTSDVRSKHHVKSIADYQSHTNGLFEDQFGPLSDMALLTLLPGYHPNSSLLYMVANLLEASSGITQNIEPNQTDRLDDILREYKKEKRPTLLFGVTHALLDYTEKHKIQFPELMVMETGGMKGRCTELPRIEVHTRLKAAFGVSTIYSEYGMTELFSQAYSTENGIFHPNLFFMVLPGDLYDPLSHGEYEKPCRLNIIDLANHATCSFIATEDLGRVFASGEFEVLGRLDHADLRGCNLLVADSHDI